MDLRYWILTLLWIAWCVIHSGMISITATEFFRKRLGSGFRFYRVFFNSVAFATLIPVIIYAKTLGGQVYFQGVGFLVVFQILFLIVAALLGLAGIRQYDMLEVLGVRQIRRGSRQGALTRTGRLSTSGILGLVRHPWYLSAILLLWSTFRSIDTARLITNLILTVYIVLGTFLEERKLLAEFGDAYRKYQKQVPMLLPLKWTRR